jgi:hypothetical protein
VTTPGARSVCWSLTVRDRKLDPLVPLDGGSISGAARTGLLLLHAGQRHDTHSVIVAKADQAGELRPVGFERDKLEAASGSGLRRAVVAPGAALSEADRDDLEARGLKLRKAPDIRTALKVVQARRKRWPIAATVIATGLAIVVAWTFLRPATTPRTPARRASGPTLSAVGDRFTVGDYNGDGKADVAMAYDLGNGTVQVHRWISNGSQFTDLATDQPGPFVLGAVAGRMASGDVTGDGKDDIVMAYQNPNNTFSLHVWSAGITYAGSWYTSDQVGRVGDRFTVGDYNGDGKADVAIAYDRRNGTMQIYRWISTGSQLTELATYESGPFHLSAVGGRIASGDVNGDGKDDIVMAYHYQNDHSFYYHVWSAGIDYAYRLYSGQLNLDRIGARFTVGDYNDDGKADVAMAYDRGNGTMRIYRWNSTGSQFTDLPTHDFGPFNLANVAGRMASGDVNGDGKDDIVMAYQHPDGTFILHVWSAGVVDAGQWYTNQ